MRSKNYKGRCVKKTVSKCEDVCRLYDRVQEVYVDNLQDNPDVVSFQCNVYLEGLEVGEFTSDFVAVKKDGSLMVRECVWRKNIQRPRTLKLLDASRDYWRARGVEDWGIVIDAEKE